MKKAACILFAFIVPYNAAQLPGAYARLKSFLPGKWIMQTHVATTIEEWKTDREGVLQGNSVRIKGKDTVPQESISLSLNGNDVFYIPTVHGQNGGNPVPFKLTDATANRFMFANPQHDFPQKIVYEFVHKDSLHAWIEGVYILEGTPAKNIRRDYYYSRK